MGGVDYKTAISSYSNPFRSPYITVDVFNDTGDILLEVDGKLIRSERSLSTVLSVRPDRVNRSTFAIIAVDEKAAMDKSRLAHQPNDGVNGRVNQSQELFAKVYYVLGSFIR